MQACLQSHVDSDRVQEAPIQMLRAGACNYRAQGVDGLYLAHWFNNWPYEVRHGCLRWGVRRAGRC